MTNKPTVKRIRRVPDQWPTWPFTRLHPEVMQQLVAKLEKRKQEDADRQRKFARDKALQQRRGK